MKLFMICVLILILIQPNKIYAQEPITTTSRDILTYEVLSIENKNDMLNLTGWAYLKYTQHYYGNNTHSINIVLKSKNQIKRYNASLTNINLNEFTTYRGYPSCKEKEYYQKTCNYEYQNVGFNVSIPLNELESSNYDFYIEVRTKQTNLYYQSPLYYAYDYNKTFQYSERDYELTSDFKYINLAVIEATYVVRSGPSPGSNAMSLGSSCSTSYGNDAFFMKGTVYNTIRNIHKYKGIMTYFEVGVKRYSNCVDNRVRVVEDISSKAKSGFIPGSAVNFSGVPLSLKIVDHRKPTIKVVDTTINQYSTYDSNKYIEIRDKEGILIPPSKISKTTTVNPNIPGEYQTCYSYPNLNLKACGKVSVIKVPVKIRYVSLRSSRLLPTKSIWKRNTFQNILDTILRK